MTEQEAREILNQQVGSTSLDGILRVHEALLVVGGMTDERERAAMLEKVRAAYTGA